MDPASMGIGIVSLTFQIFSGCVKGYQLLTEAKGMPKEFQFLRIRLKTEQYRLLDWAHVANLDAHDEGLLISNASKGLLIDVLDQQQRLLTLFGRFDEKYKPLRHPLISDLSLEEQGVPVSPPNSRGPQALARSDTTLQDRFPDTSNLLRKSLEWVQSTKTYPARLKWASWDKQKVEALIAKLTALNDFMLELLNNNQLQLLHTKQTRTEFQIMQLNSKIDHLLQIFESAMTMQTSTVKGSVNILSLFLQTRGMAEIAQSLPDGAKMHNLAALAQTKALNSAIQLDGTLTDEFARDLHLHNTANEIMNVKLSRNSIQLIDRDPNEGHEGASLESQRVEAYYTLPNPDSQGRVHKQQVWIEWKTYEPQNYDGAPDAKVEERIQRLAALLRENRRTEQFHTPHCLGYFRDTADAGSDNDEAVDRCRFGLVFEKPAGVHPSTRPTSLLDLLRDPTAPMPSLTDRVTLMRRIAECIEQLHAVNWLHKGLRSNNILFFCDASSSTSPTTSSSTNPSPAPDHIIHAINFSAPYISGFDYSRPAANEDMTERPPENPAHDLYRHPRVQGSNNRDQPATSSSAAAAAAPTSNFKKSYDLYSLGVILLEIAYWQPVDAILGIPNVDDARPSTTLKVRQRLLGQGEGFLSFVRSRLGNTVEGVVSSCLEGAKAFGVEEGVDETAEEIGAQLQRGFYDRVVSQLEKVWV